MLNGGEVGNGRKGNPGGDGSVTVNELGAILNYTEKKITLNINDTYKIDKNKINYTELNDIQTNNLTVGSLNYESLDISILNVDSQGVILPKNKGITKVKITDTVNQKVAYIIVEIIKGQTSAQVKNGDGFTLALKENGTVWEYGKEIGNEPKQVMVDGEKLKDIIDIGAGINKKIAVNKVGKVYTWGNEPKEVLSLNNIKKVDCNGDTFYALDKDGTVYTWKEEQVPERLETEIKIADIDGDLLLGENGRVYEIDKLPEEVRFTKNICDIAQGVDHYVFATLEGYIYGIGKGDYGQIGNGKLNDKETITLAKTEDGEYIKDGIKVTAGNKISGAISESGKAYTWGNNFIYSLGITKNGNLELSPKIVYGTEIQMLQDKEGNELSLVKIENLEVRKKSF